jgi:flagellin
LDADGGAQLTKESVLTDHGTTYGDDVLQGFKETWEETSSKGTGTTDMSFHVGSNSGETLVTRIGAVNVSALGISDTDLTGDARIAIVHLDEAITFVNAQRGNIGAQLNRLDSTIATLASGKENASASRSRIQDADFAVETAALLRAQIMQGSINSMLAQANATPSLALRLLR